MAAPAGRYVQILSFRVVLAVLAILTGAWALHETGDGKPIWLVGSLLAVGGSAGLIWPLVVPARDRTMSVHSLGPAFFLAGMFLLPPAALVLAISFAVALAGLVQGWRAYRTVFQLSTFLLVLGGFSVHFNLGPRSSDFMFQPAPRAGLELLITGAAFTAVLIVRSIALRLEQGDEAPHWGAFQPPALVEMILCMVFATSITVLARVHLALLSVVAIEMVLIGWFLNRYAWYAAEARERLAGPVRRRRPRAEPVLRRVEAAAASVRVAGEASRLEPTRLDMAPRVPPLVEIAESAPATEEPPAATRPEAPGDEEWRSARTRRAR